MQKQEKLTHVKFDRCFLQFFTQRVIGKPFEEQVSEILNPKGQFEEEMPNLSAFAFLAQQINYDYDPQTKIQTMLSYICNDFLPIYLWDKQYKIVWNVFRLLKSLTINLTSITLLDILVNNEDCINLCYKIAKKPLTVWSWFSQAQAEREYAITEAGELLQFWTDFTMMYQGEFKYLYKVYRKLR
jgi:hypothetical protein